MLVKSTNFLIALIFLDGCTQFMSLNYLVLLELSG